MGHLRARRPLRAGANVRLASTPDAKPASGDSRPPAFLNARLRVFASCIIGYACYYLTRNSLTYVSPAMVAPGSGLQMDIQAVGLITSLFPLCYGASKFVSGVLGDYFDPRTLLAGGLLATATANVAFGLSSSMPVFCGLWCLNGLLQGCGAPSCAKILSSWFASFERGTYWSLWNLSHNIGGFAAPVMAGTCANKLGWRFGFLVPGLVSAAVAAGVYAVCRGAPEDMGFPAVEEPAKTTSGEASKGAPASSGGSLGLVLRTVPVWLLALSYLCVYAVRQGVTSWTVFFLLETGRASNAAAAAWRVTGLELGGLAGSLCAGKASDTLVRRATSGKVGRRVRVVVAYLAGLAGALVLLAHVPRASALAQWLSIFLVGFCLYGPQMLVGLCGAEVVGRGAVGASEGFLGLVAYTGAACAGLPLSTLIKTKGWPAFFKVLVACALVPIALLSPLLNARAHSEKADEAKDA